MNAKAAYQFLKPSLSQLNELERERLCRLILDKVDREEAASSIISKSEMKKRLKTHFKSCIKY